MAEYIWRPNDGVHGSELWVYDPAIGASMVADIYPGINSSGPDDFNVFFGELYFTANSSPSARELWRYDPADPAAGVRLAADTLPGNDGGNPKELLELNGKLYFRATSINNRRGLWVYDPTCL